MQIQYRSWFADGSLGHIRVLPQYHENSSSTLTPNAEDEAIRRFDAAARRVDQSRAKAEERIQYFRLNLPHWSGPTRSMGNSPEEDRMPKKRHKPEEIVAKLRQVDVLTSQGMSVADAIRQIGVTEVTYYRWRNEYGGLKTDQVRRIKELEKENLRLRKAVSDLTLDKLILAEASKGNY